MMFSKKALVAGIALACAATLGGAATPKRAGQTAQASADTTPPVVRVFGVGTAVDLGVTMSQLVVDLSLTDDLSGVDMFYLHLSGPNGPGDQVGVFVNGATNFRERVLVPMSPFTAPGVWEITAIQGWDRAGNHFFVDESLLRALGNTRFTVTNKATDAKPPKLISGKLMTPVVSRSASAPGTSLPYNEARAEVLVSDAGNHVVSGPNLVELSYCLTTSGPCIDMMNIGRGVYGPGKRTLQAASSVRPSDATGTYRLARVRVTDNAGNARSYVGTDFGGDTDFSTMFSSVTIEVTP